MKKELDFDGRRVAYPRTPGMLVRTVTNEVTPEPWYFGDRYFARKPTDFERIDEELVGWQPMFKAGAEDEMASGREGDDQDATEVEEAKEEQ